MANSTELPSLTDFAIESLFNDILCCISSVTNEDERAKTVKEVRRKLDEYLVGPKYYSEVRETLVKKFYKKTPNLSSDEDWYNIHLFFDCVLDESIINFPKRPYDKTENPNLFSSLPAINVMETITSLCPHLKHFSMSSNLLCPILLEDLTRFGQSFSNLGNLTSLNLDWCRPSSSSDTLQFFTHLGESCPQLEMLVLGERWNFKPEQLFFLTLGQHAEALSQLVKQQIFESGMHRVQFDDQYTTTITKSLKVFSFIDSISCPKYCGESQAFLLRHFPKLKQFKMCPKWPAFCLPKALALLQDSLDYPRLVRNHFVPAADNANGPPRLRWTLNTPPPCKYNLQNK